MATANQQATLLPSLARTATPTAATLTNEYHRGIVVTIDVTAAGGGEITPTIQGVDPTSGKAYTILAGAAKSTTGTVVMRVYPGSAVAANLSANDVLPRDFKISVAHTDAQSITYSVGYALVA